MQVCSPCALAALLNLIKGWPYDSGGSPLRGNCTMKIQCPWIRGLTHTHRDIHSHKGRGKQRKPTTDQPKDTQTRAQIKKSLRTSQSRFASIPKPITYSYRFILTPSISQLNYSSSKLTGPLQALAFACHTPKYTMTTSVQKGRGTARDTLLQLYLNPNRTHVTSV